MVNWDWDCIFCLQIKIMGAAIKFSLDHIHARPCQIWSFRFALKLENIFIYFRLSINYDYGTTFIRQRQITSEMPIVWFDWSEQLSRSEMSLFGWLPKAFVMDSFNSESLQPRTITRLFHFSNFLLLSPLFGSHIFEKSIKFIVCYCAIFCVRVPECDPIIISQTYKVQAYIVVGNTFHIPWLVFSASREPQTRDAQQNTQNVCFHTPDLRMRAY